MSLDWEFSTNFHLLSHLTLSSMKSNAENSLRCQADAPPAQIEVDEDEKKTQLTHEKTFWRILWTLRWSCWPNFLRLSTFFADNFLQLWGRDIHFIDAYSPEKSYSSKMTVKTSLMVDMPKEEVCVCV